MESNKTVMVFGVGELQKSIINRAHKMGLRVVGIDPFKDAVCKDDVDAFETVGGLDFKATIAVAMKHNVDAIATAATDKPLVMMSRVAKELGFRFCSEDTAVWSTDKYQMKQRFMDGGVPCAAGRIVHNSKEADKLNFPVICKPRDNSGSRGVKLCRTANELQECIDEALRYSLMDTVLVEEYIEGQEYSIESLHYNGKSEVIQFTQKTTTDFPYNVELGHLQPADLTEEQKDKIRKVIERIGKCLKFENCPSHTELKINERGIFVIETSPRLGGDYITSTLVPLSTGVNMEDQVLNMSLGEPVDTKKREIEKTAGVRFFCFPLGKVTSIDPKIEDIRNWPGVVDFNLKFGVGSLINEITNSMDRYGQVIVCRQTKDELVNLLDECEHRVQHCITIKKCEN